MAHDTYMVKGVTTKKHTEVMANETEPVVANAMASAPRPGRKKQIQSEKIVGKANDNL